MSCNTIADSRAFEMLRVAPVMAGPVGVDDQQKIIRGYVMAELGQFRTGRGEFDLNALRTIVNLVNSAGPSGIKTRYGHPRQDGSRDDLDSFVGRTRNARLDGSRVRGDLHLDPVAFLSPNGGTSRGDYLLTRVKSDPDSFGASLVLRAEKEHRLDARQRRQVDSAGRPLPPVWTPFELQSCDIVDTPDAVHGGFLSANDEAFARASTMLDQVFADHDRQKLKAYFDHYLGSRFGPDATADAEPAGQAGPTIGAGLGADTADVELLRARWANLKRKAGV